MQVIPSVTRVSYPKFKSKLLRINFYVSLFTVFGVGGTYVFSTIELRTMDHALLMGLTFIVSFITMSFFDYLALSIDLAPLRTLERITSPTKEEWVRAHRRIHKLPILMIRRILVPHLIGFIVPAVILLFVVFPKVLPESRPEYVGSTIAGGILLTLLHLVFEFLLVSEAIKPMLLSIQQDSKLSPSLLPSTRIKMRNKFLFISLTMSLAPLSLLAIATDIRLVEIAETIKRSLYWQWSLVILALGIIIAIGAGILSSKAIIAPIEQLNRIVDRVTHGDYKVQMDNVYNDEFSDLIDGFNEMIRELHNREEQNRLLLESLITSLSAALDARDPYTAGHSLRVRDYSLQIAKRLALSPQLIEQLNRSAILHDIGKIGVPDAVLQKDTKLTDEEFNMIKSHTVKGEAILKSIHPAESFAQILTGVRSHHERYDGRGYPDGLHAEQIPLFGRIIAVADAFDAMTSDRPYRKGMSISQAIEIIRDGLGTQWDPEIGKIFLDEIGA